MYQCRTKVSKISLKSFLDVFNVSMSHQSLQDQSRIFHPCLQCINVAPKSPRSVLNLSSMSSLYQCRTNVSKICLESFIHVFNVSMSHQRLQDLSRIFHPCLQCINVASKSPRSVLNLSSMSSMYQCRIKVSKICLESFIHVFNVSMSHQSLQDQSRIFHPCLQCINVASKSPRSVSNLSSMSSMYQCLTKVSKICLKSFLHVFNVSMSHQSLQDLSRIFPPCLQCINVAPKSPRSLSNLSSMSSLYQCRTKVSKICLESFLHVFIVSMLHQSLQDLSRIFPPCLHCINVAPKSPVSVSNLSSMSSMYQCRTKVSKICLESFLHVFIVSMLHQRLQDLSRIFPPCLQCINVAPKSPRSLSNLSSMSSMYQCRTKVSKISLKSFLHVFNVSMSHQSLQDQSQIFPPCLQCTNVAPKSPRSVSNLSSMSSMYQCRIKVSSFCLESFLDVFNVSMSHQSLQNPPQIFPPCLQCINVRSKSPRSVSSLSSMSSMYQCRTKVSKISLKSFLDVFNVSMSHQSLQDQSQIFPRCLQCIMSHQSLQFLSRIFPPCLQCINVSSKSPRSVSNLSSMSSMYQCRIKVSNICLKSFPPCLQCINVAPKSPRSVSNLSSMSSMYQCRTKVSKICLKSFLHVFNVSMSHQSLLDLSQIFQPCLQCINVAPKSPRSVSNLSSMSSMYQCCTKVSKICLESFLHVFIVSMLHQSLQFLSRIFPPCLQCINVAPKSPRSVSNLSSMSSLYQCCTNVSKICLESFLHVFNVSMSHQSLQDLSRIFPPCLQCINVAPKSPRSVLNLSSMSSMYQCRIKVSKISLKSFLHVFNVPMSHQSLQDQSQIFPPCLQCTNVASKSPVSVSNLSSMSSMYQCRTKVSKIRLKSFLHVFNVSMSDLSLQDQSRVFPPCLQCTNVAPKSPRSVSNLSSMSSMYQCRIKVSKISLKSFLDVFNVSCRTKVSSFCLESFLHVFNVSMSHQSLQDLSQIFPPCLQCINVASKSPTSVSNLSLHVFNVSMSHQSLQDLSQIFPPCLQCTNVAPKSPRSVSNLSSMSSMYQCRTKVS